MKKLVKGLLIIFLFLNVILCIKNVKADSGWDYDYDYDSDWGSSWDSDYDSDWGSSWDSDYGSSYDSDYSSSSSHSSKTSRSSLEELLVQLFLTLTYVIIVTFISILFIKKNAPKYKPYKTSSPRYKTYHSSFVDLPNNVVIMTGMSSNEFKYLAFNIYKNIQNAWSDFDYENLRKYTTDELYNTYKMQLDTLKLKHQKNIMTDIERLTIKINDIKVENGIISVETYMNIRMYDYVVDSKNNVVRGTNKRKANIEYLITFVKSNEKIRETICPNCGAKVDAVSSNECDYCGSIIVVDSKKFVMSKKKCINQRME